MNVIMFEASSKGRVMPEVGRYRLHSGGLYAMGPRSGKIRLTNGY